MTADSGQLELIEAMDLQVRRWVKITWSSGAVWSIKALVKRYTAGASLNGKVPFSSSFRTSGAWTRT